MATWQDIDTIVGTAERNGCRFTLKHDPAFSGRAAFPFDTVVFLAYTNRRGQRVDVSGDYVHHDLHQQLHAVMTGAGYVVHVVDTYEDGVEAVIHTR
jgi:hypothetical protein